MIINVEIDLRNDGNARCTDIHCYLVGKRESSIVWDAGLHHELSWTSVNDNVAILH